MENKEKDLQNTFTIQKTKDGSETIFSSLFQTTYHSIHGAIQESEHVFISNGLNYVSERIKEINILEIGFGTGLNAFLTFKESQTRKLQINYTGIEKHPLPSSVYIQLSLSAEPDFLNLHKSEWNKDISLTGNFSLTKINTGIEDYQLNQKFDLVYFDAFAPSAQHEMWSEEIFQKIFDAMNSGAALVTFCAKGDVKRGLKKVGFKVEALPGAPGKREMTRALKM